MLYPIHMFEAEAGQYAKQDLIKQSAEEFLTNQLECLDLAERALLLPQERMANHYGIKHQQLDYKVSDKIRLSADKVVELRIIKYPSLGTSV